MECLWCSTASSCALLLEFQISASLAELLLGERENTLGADTQTDGPHKTDVQQRVR